MRKDERKLNDLAEDSPFKAKGYTVVKQWSFQDSKFKRVARPDIYRSSMNKTFYEIVQEERNRKRLIEEKKQLEKTGDILAQMYDQDDQDENGGVSRPQTAMPSPSYFQTGVNTKVWSKRPFSARCENPGAHTPRKPFFTPGSQSYKSSFKEKAEERILYFHELDRESKVVQKKRFMLERISGKEKNRTLSRPQSADSWRRHHYQTRNKNKLKDLLSIRSIEVKAQPSRDLY